MKKCSKCASYNKDTSNFCLYCGNRLDDNAVPQQQVQKADPKECQITFTRPNVFQWSMNSFHITIDNASTYELKNGCEIKIRLACGHHTVKIAMFATPKKKQFEFDAVGDTTFICKPNPAALFSYLSVPVKVSDSNGREY